MTAEEKLQRQININIQLRRQLENCRKDVVEYCAKFCEDHTVEFRNDKVIVSQTIWGNMEGHMYAKALRGIIGK